MKARLFTLLLLAAPLLIVHPAAAGFSNEQHKEFDCVLQSAMDGLKQDVGNMDSMLKALGEAYARSAYGKDAASENMRQQLGAEAAQLKGEITRLESDIARHRAFNRDPAVMIFLLYKWVRGVTEMADLANASAGKNDSAANELFAGMIRFYESQQDTLGTAIQVIASHFIDAPKL
jgi:hypothetical protein